MFLVSPNNNPVPFSPVFAISSVYLANSDSGNSAPNPFAIALISSISVLVFSIAVSLPTKDSLVIAFSLRACPMFVKTFSSGPNLRSCLTNLCCGVRSPYFCIPRSMSVIPWANPFKYPADCTKNLERMRSADIFSLKAFSLSDNTFIKSSCAALYCNTTWLFFSIVCSLSISSCNAGDIVASPVSVSILEICSNNNLYSVIGFIKLSCIHLPQSSLNGTSP